MKRKRVVLLCVLAVVIVGGSIAAVAITSMLANYHKEVAELTISDVDLALVDDGTYTGSYKIFPVSAEVEVSVRDHRITGIKLLRHDNGRGGPAEIIPDEVVKAQTLTIDAVAGATTSSKVILKAIENALRSTPAE